MGYTPTTQGGGATTGNAFSASASGDFAVVTDLNGPRHPFAHEPLPGDPHDPRTTLASDMLRGLIGMSQTDLLQLQGQLVSAGYLPKNATSGVADSDTRKAYAELLQDTSTYNSQGINLTPTDILNRRTQSLATTGKLPSDDPSYQTALHTYSPTDPARVRLTAEAAFKEALGRKPKPAELAKFVSHFSSAELGAQATAFNAEDAIRADGIRRDYAKVGQQVAGGEAAIGSDIASRVAAMAAAAPGAITVTSGVRSTAHQKELFDAAVRKYGSVEAARKWVAPPGHSQHELGNANDLHFSDPKTRAWAHANAARFGLTFPLSNESWHVEKIEARRGGAPAGGFVSAPAPAAGAAPISQSISVTQPDLTAQATEYARNSNPTETQAHDIGTQFDNFIALLQKGVI